MIIILEPQKDAYVTNLKTSNNDASYSNVGHAATLDLFKLYNENKNSNSWALIEFASDGSTIDDGEIITITDSLGVTKNFEFDNNNNHDPDNVQINTENLENNAEYSRLIAAAINSVIDFNVSAYNNSNNQLLLKQNISGESGDTLISLPSQHIISKVQETIDGVTYGKFSRIDFSTLLIKFDLESVKNNWGIGDDLENEGAFNNLKAELLLKDVTTGISKPREYSLEAYELLKEFDEGTGKDTIYFSDMDFCNFNKINKEENWEISNFVSKNTDAKPLDIESIIPKNENQKGDENLVFDITSYVKNNLEVINDLGLLIKFTDDIIFNKNSYFVKRLGSRHLINKSFIPELRIKINDSDSNIPTNSHNKVRYLNNEEVFYLFNNVSGRLQNILAPEGFDVNTNLRLRITNRSESIIFVDDIVANNHNLNPIKNYKGDITSGIRKATITNTQLSKFQSQVAENIKNNKLEAKTIWFWKNNDVEHIILKENSTFFTSEVVDDVKYENLLVSIKSQENNLIANNNIVPLEVYFVDTKKEFNAVKVPYELPSENLGEVYYQVYDVETNELIIDYDETYYSTKMFYDGEKYIFNLFLPSHFKNRRINFKFKYKNYINDSSHYLYNENYKLRLL